MSMCAVSGWRDFPQRCEKGWRKEVRVESERREIALEKCGAKIFNPLIFKSKIAFILYNGRFCPQARKFFQQVFEPD